MERTSQLQDRVLATAADFRVGSAAGADTLVVRGTSLGDMTVFLPFLAAVIQQSNSRVDIAILSTTGNVAEALLPHFADRIVSVDPLTTGSFLSSLRHARGKFRGRSYNDVIVAVQNCDYTLARVRRLIAARVLAGPRARVHGLAVSARLTSAHATRRHDEQVVNQAHSASVATGIPLSASRADLMDLLAFTGAERETVHGVLAGLRATMPMIAVHPISKDERKRWPLERYAELLATLRKQHSWQPLFVGGVQDREPGLALARALGEDASVVVAGKLSPRETMLALQSCVCFVGNDGAPGHLAALAGIPVVSIFCNWEPAGLWEPLAAPASVSIRPALNLRTLPRFGIDAISTESVADAIRSVMQMQSGHEIRVVDNGGEITRHVGGPPVFSSRVDTASRTSR